MHIHDKKSLKMLYNMGHYFRLCQIHIIRGMKTWNCGLRLKCSAKRNSLDFVHLVGRSVVSNEKNVQKSMRHIYYQKISYFAKINIFFSACTRFLPTLTWILKSTLFHLQRNSNFWYHYQYRLHYSVAKEIRVFDNDTITYPIFTRLVTR